MISLKYWYLWHIELISHNNVSWLDDKPIAGCDLSDVSVQLSSSGLISIKLSSTSYVLVFFYNC
jgi:hypothetical protein